MRAMMSTFDHFMTVFVSALAVAIGSMFMSFTGGGLRPYEANALAAGYHSLLNAGAARAEHAAITVLAAAAPPAAAAAPASVVAPAPDDIPELLGGPNDPDAPRSAPRQMAFAAAPSEVAQP